MEKKHPEAVGRSRKGAWIEIDLTDISDFKEQGRSRKGAWIEILSYMRSVFW